jgi:hypothetical protein
MPHDIVRRNKKPTHERVFQRQGTTKWIRKCHKRRFAGAKKILHPKMSLFVVALRAQGHRVNMEVQHRACGDGHFNTDEKDAFGSRIRRDKRSVFVSLV